MKHTVPTQYKGVTDYLKDLCMVYRGETDNPHEVNSLMNEERTIQFLRFHLWDAERSVLENPAEWKYRVLEEYGSVPLEVDALAKKLYEYAVSVKLNLIKEFGTDLWPMYKRLI